MCVHECCVRKVEWELLRQRSCSCSFARVGCFSVMFSIQERCSRTAAIRERAVYFREVEVGAASASGREARNLSMMQHKSLRLIYRHTHADEASVSHVTHMRIPQTIWLTILLLQCICWSVTAHPSRDSHRTEVRPHTAACDDYSNTQHVVAHTLVRWIRGASHNMHAGRLANLGNMLAWHGPQCDFESLAARAPPLARMLARSTNALLPLPPPRNVA